LGGPFVLPHIYNGRNKTFFFVSYEGLRLRQPLVSSPMFVPTAAARQNATGLAKDLLNAFPLPNGPVSATDPSVARFTASYSDPSTLNATGFRIDQSVGARLTLFARYNNSPSKISQRAIFATPNSVQDATSDTQTVTAGATALISPRLTDDLRFNYSRNEAGSRYRLDTFGGAVVPDPSAFFPSFTSADQSTSIVTLGPSTGSPLTWGLNAINVQRQINIVETGSLATGSHALKFGFDYRRLSPINQGALYRRFVTFNSTASALAGRVDTLRQIGTNLYLYPLYNNYSAFLQDTWKMGHRLTVTYGLRWEVNPAPTEQKGNLPLTVTNIASGKPQLAPQGTRLYDTSFGNVAPRLGVAYRLTDRGTVLRGGIGLFYDLGYTFTGSAFSTTNYPFGNTVAATNVAITSPSINAPVPAVSVTPPYQRLFGYALDYKLPYTLEYNVTLEQAIGSHGVVSGAYVAAIGRRLGRVASLRNPTANLGPDFTRIDYVTNDATSDYHALQLKYEHRLSRGLQALSSYSFAKSLDTVSDETIVNFQAPSALLNPRQDRGPSAFDVRHAASGAVSYDIPGPGLVRGFGIDAIFQARSSTPLNVLTGRDVFGLGFTNVSRPDLVPGAPVYIDDPSVAHGRRINRAAFTVPATAVQGNLGRNALRGFQVAQLDLSLRRRFPIAERASFLVRMDAFNVLNHPNFANPTAVLTDPNSVFGISTGMLGRSLGSGGTSGGFSPLYQFGGPRSMQLSLAFQF
jgi:hypothetical protein